MNENDYQQRQADRTPAADDALPSSSLRLPDLTPNRGWILAITTVGGFLVTFMTSAVNIALPVIGQEFRASAVTLSWISLSYLLMAGAIMLPLGRLADLYGRVRFFIGGMIIFSVIALASAFAPSAAVLLALRAIHGVGLAVGAVTAVALVILAYPPEARGRALGLNLAGVYLGLTVGPMLGGLIIHNLGWRGLFLVVGGLGFVTLLLSLWKLRGLDWREPKLAPFDAVGSVLWALSLTALLLGFSFLPDLPGALLIAGGLIGLSVFVWWESRAADPLLHVHLLRRNRVFAFSNAAALINFSATFAVIFLMSLYLQYNRGLNPQTAGFILVIGTFVQTIISPFAGRLADRVQARYVASMGMGLCVPSLLALAFVGEATPYWYIISALCVLGVGYAFFATPITHTVIGSVEKRHVGIASATLATMRSVGMSVSMGLATLVLAVQVGRDAIQPADYPRLLNSVQISFLMFTVLCLMGIAASMVGPRRSNGAPG